MPDMFTNTDDAPLTRTHIVATGVPVSTEGHSPATEPPAAHLAKKPTSSSRNRSGGSCSPSPPPQFDAEAEEGARRRLSRSLVVLFAINVFLCEMTGVVLEYLSVSVAAGRMGTDGVGLITSGVPAMVLSGAVTLLIVAEICWLRRVMIGVLTFRSCPRCQSAEIEYDYAFFGDGDDDGDEEEQDGQKKKKKEKKKGRDDEGDGKVNVDRACIVGSYLGMAAHSSVLYLWAASLPDEVETGLETNVRLQFIFYAIQIVITFAACKFY